MRVIGVGQRVAGDDGVGHAVLEALALAEVPEGTELLHVRDASELVELLQVPSPVLVVDAVVGAGPVGEVLVLGEQALCATPMSSVSSHGLSVKQALQLARSLHPEQTSSRVQIVAVSIEAPRSYRDTLSPKVAGAVQQACASVMRLLEAGGELMHESSLGKQVLEAVLDEARAVRADRVVRVNGWVAETEALNPDSIAFHFAAHARGTLAEGATLELDLRWVEACCRGCGTIYKPDHHLTLCPDCGSTDGQLLGETGIAIESIEVASG